MTPAIRTRPRAIHELTVPGSLINPRTALSSRTRHDLFDRGRFSIFQRTPRTRSADDKPHGLASQLHRTRPVNTMTGGAGRHGALDLVAATVTAAHANRPLRVRAAVAAASAPSASANRGQVFASSAGGAALERVRKRASGPAFPRWRWLSPLCEALQAALAADADNVTGTYR